MELGGRSDQPFPYTDLQIKIQKKMNLLASTRANHRRDAIHSQSAHLQTVWSCQRLPNPFFRRYVAHENDDPGQGAAVDILDRVGAEFESP